MIAKISQLTHSSSSIFISGILGDSIRSSIYIQPQRLDAIDVLSGSSSCLLIAGTGVVDRVFCGIVLRDERSQLGVGREKVVADLLTDEQRCAAQSLDW